MEAEPSPAVVGQRLTVRCDCGFEVRGTADEVVGAMQDHAKNVHNMSATREQVLARAKAV